MEETRSNNTAGTCPWFLSFTFQKETRLRGAGATFLGPGEQGVFKEAAPHGTK